LFRIVFGVLRNTFTLIAILVTVLPILVLLLT
jgi:uncharacterized membrane protein